MFALLQSGKTTTTSFLAEATQLGYINVGDLVRDKNLHDGWDEQFDCHVINEDLVRSQPNYYIHFAHMQYTLPMYLNMYMYVICLYGRFHTFFMNKFQPEFRWATRIFIIQDHIGLESGDYFISTVELGLGGENFQALIQFLFLAQKKKKKKEKINCQISLCFLLNKQSPQIFLRLIILQNSRRVLHDFAWFDCSSLEVTKIYREWPILWV